jgi:hypothetical protein
MKSKIHIQKNMNASNAAESSHAKYKNSQGKVLLNYICRILNNRIRRKDIGILPLLFSLPFMFYPKILSGDTQPWILLAALIALLTYRANIFVNIRDWPMIALSILCVLAYAFRYSLEYDLIRHTYTYLAFLIFWIVCQRDKGEYLPFAVKGTVIIWFIVGFYQYLSIKMGYQIEPSGRYLAGRMGPPSLTAEASYYGTLSVLQAMYLLTDKNKKYSIYVFCAIASVFMSGSLLAMILLFFPLRKLLSNLGIKKIFVQFSLAIMINIIFISCASFTGSTSRLHDIFQFLSATKLVIQPPTKLVIQPPTKPLFAKLLADASLNLRVGHIYFTLLKHLIPSLIFEGRIDFMSQYNQFSKESGFFIKTRSNYILPAIGEMIYGSGFLAVVLLIIFLRRAQENCVTFEEKTEKLIFIIACMLNPISISNIFLILYATKKLEYK